MASLSDAKQPGGLADPELDRPGVDAVDSHTDDDVTLSSRDDPRRVDEQLDFTPCRVRMPTHGLLCLKKTNFD